MYFYSLALNMHEHIDGGQEKWFETIINQANS